MKKPMLPFTTVKDCRSPQARARPMRAAEAQEFCNFAIHLPENCDVIARVLSQICRPEVVPGPLGDGGTAFKADWTVANPSSFRSEYESIGGARFRIKQFLYDWAPPFAGQPNLWNQASRGHALRSGDVVWVGTDYKEHRGAYAELGRSSVELSVIEGHLEDDEIIRLYGAMTPVDANAARALLAVPLHEIGYWQRFRPQGPQIPYSIWTPPSVGRYAMDDWRAADAPSLDVLVHDRFARSADGYVPETLGFRALGTPEETFDLKFIRIGDRCHGLRIHHRRLAGAAAATCDGRFFREERVLDAGTLMIDLAYVCETLGPFEFKVTRTDRDTETVLMFTPFTAHTKAGCTALVKSLYRH
jgi:hypothetical protein